MAFIRRLLASVIRTGPLPKIVVVSELAHARFPHIATNLRDMGVSLVIVDRASNEFVAHTLDNDDVDINATCNDNPVATAVHRGLSSPVKDAIYCRVTQETSANPLNYAQSTFIISLDQSIWPLYFGLLRWGHLHNYLGRLEASEKSHESRRETLL